MEVFFKDAERWMRQADADIKAAEHIHGGGFFAQSCFLAQQAAAKALRAFLFLNKEDAREAKSVADLLDRAITYDEGFKDFVGKSTSLDLYYKTARFPDALPGGIPSEIITDRDSTIAIRLASDVLKAIEKKRKGLLPDIF